MSRRGGLARAASPSWPPRDDARSRAAAGRGLLGALVALGVGLGLVLAASLALLRAMAAHEAPGAARALVTDVRFQRQAAVGRGVRRGLVFRRGADGAFRVSVHEDGDGDGLLAGDVESGRDPRLEGPELFAQRYGGARPGFLPAVHEAGGLPSPPPSSRLVEDLDDPVRFGRSDTVSCSPRGRVSSGTLYLTDGRVRQMAVVVHGATGRVRLWEYDPATGSWRRR